MDKIEAPELLETMAAQVEVGGKNGLAAVAERRAKIICTLGPSSNSEAMIRELLCAGMDVARLNFSHGTHEEHARVIERVRRAAEKEDRTVCILQDLQGPKMRTGRLKYRTPVALKTGSRVTITPRDVPGTTSVISTTFQDLAREVNTGSRILLSDGLIELRVKAIRNDDVECEVVNGGLLAEHQGINLPGAVLSVPSLTPKDYKDLEFGLEHGVDVVAVSFIRCAEDVRRVKRLIGERKSDVPVIAKLEKPQAVDDLDNILEAADGVMVARGDLGVEMPPETVPIIQKNVIRRAADFRKPVITATQMLESMIDNPRPTRAEASDVANAVFDGTDAVMLSGETASGRYPVEAVTIMARIVVEAENHVRQSEPPRRRREHRATFSIAETICESIAHAAADVHMRAIAVFTETGNTARLISKYRPRVPVFAFTPFAEVGNRTNLLWGVRPVVLPQAVDDLDNILEAADGVMVARGDLGVEMP
ncbi:MAG TPA: pyruvate kinase, partial [Terriglobales bacterium]|nr:pyruvate kinase [Terriglobales bacterium]